MCLAIRTTSLREKVGGLEALQDCDEGPPANYPINKWRECPFLTKCPCGKRRFCPFLASNEGKPLAPY